jgi:hypothetical protein
MLPWGLSFRFQGRRVQRSLDQSTGPLVTRPRRPRSGPERGRRVLRGLDRSTDPLDDSSLGRPYRFRRDWMLAGALGAASQDALLRNTDTHLLVTPTFLGTPRFFAATGGWPVRWTPDCGTSYRRMRTGLPGSA